jgi:hydrogenase expression/formation protein HypC
MDTGLDDAMCLGIPALVLERTQDLGRVDFGGTIRQANLSLVDAKVGDYVIVHAGFAIQVLDEKDALETLELFREVFGEEVRQTDTDIMGKAAKDA